MLEGTSNFLPWKCRLQDLLEEVAFGIPCGEGDHTSYTSEGVG